MKGVIFTELLDMMDEAFSPDLTEQIIEEAELPSGGAYTSVGTYDHREILRLVEILSRHAQVPIPDLVYSFGKHLAGRFIATHPEFLTNAYNTFDLLSSIEDHVHTEVRKLNPDAELPTFETEQPDESTLVMTYSSSRPFADLAAGLIQGTIEHFAETIDIERESISTHNPTIERFTLIKCS